jgi:dTDP-4-dehydrorhamnose 3,5-epimerase
MRVSETSLPGVCIIEPKVFPDDRGFFLESYHARKYAEFGISGAFVQDNHSCSSRGTLRGLHYQLKNPQGKLCRVISGSVFDVAVDIRRGSPTFGQWVGVVLSAENRRQIYIPPGFAHGFYTLSEQAEFLYKCDNFYTPGDEFGIAWDDPDLSIAWPLSLEPLLSAKDRNNPQLFAVERAKLPTFESQCLLAV